MKSQKLPAMCKVVIILSMMAICLSSPWLQAQSTGTTVPLYTNIGDGFATFHVNEFGSFRGCGGPGLVFDPLGAFGPKQADCYSTLYISDTVNMRRTPVADNEWSYYNNCGQSGETPPSAAANVTSDVTVGTHTRITQFSLPEFPELQVQLTQVVCGNKMVQTYAITNTSNTTLYLRLTRSGDLDIEYTNNFTQNYAGEYPLGSSNPVGGIVLDQSTNFGVAFTAVPAADAVFEGWRVQVGGAGSFGHSATWGNYGYLPAPWPGVNGDGLNGMWTNPGGLNTNGICGVSATDIPMAANFASYYGTFPARDMNLIIQSKLVLPGLSIKTYITETIAEPGANCCQGPNCGTLSGNVSVDAGGCSTGAPLANQMVVATETSSLLNYYGLTDAAGNYMINAPFGTYSVTLDISANLSCGTAFPTYMLSSSNPAIINVDMLTNSICTADLFIAGSYPASTAIPGFCGLPPRTPCPGFPFEFCFSLLNTGTMPILAGSDFPFQLPPGFTINSISPPATPTPGSCWSSYASNAATLNTSLTSGNLCSFCVNTTVPTLVVSPLPWVSVFTSGSSASCSPTDPLLDSEIAIDTAACSCDPNYKWAYPIGCGPQHVIGDVDITYNIEFDNIGTTPAGRVVVIDRLDTDLDMGSFRILQTTYPLSDARIHPVVGNPGQFEVHFIFDGINLPPISQDPEAVGRIIYRISPKSGTTDGSLIENFATIHFDNNPPINTNTVFHTFRSQPSPVVQLPSQSIYQGYGTNCGTLAPTVTGGLAPYSYAWSTGATTSSVQVCPATTTTYSVTVTDAAGCQSATSVTVTVVDVRCGNNLNKVLLCHNGHEICVSPNAVATHLGHGDVLGPCVGNAKSAPVEEAMPVPRNGMSLDLLPNPASGATTVRFAAPDDGFASIELFGMDGRCVMQVWTGNVDGNSPRSVSLNLSQVPAGIYALRMSSTSGQLTKRLVVER